MSPKHDVDLSSGLDVSRETVLATRPDIDYWAENLLFTLYDPNLDLGMWLHMATVPSDWSLSEDLLLVYLPADGGVLHQCTYAATPPERRPAGANMAFRCVEPFNRWAVTYKGRLPKNSYTELQAGRAREGLKFPLAFNLDVECTTPVWDAHASVTKGPGHGSMRDQAWASDHYQQLVQVQGSITLEEGEFAIDATGWRDHSRGPRPWGKQPTWGGHAIVNCYFPESGRGFGLMQMWKRDGEITYAAGFVVNEKGELHHANVHDVPRFYEPTLSGDPVPVRLTSDGGDVDLLGRTVKSCWMTRNMGLARGVEREGEASILDESFARFEWDGEVGYGLCERSDHLNSPAGELRAPKG